MIQVVFNAATAFLLDDQPNWSAGIVVDASMPASYERGITGRETRRPTGDTLRLALKFSCNLNSAAAITTLRNSLQALNVQPVLCPFWPGGFAAGTMPLITAAFYVLFNADGTYSSIQPAAALGGGFAKTAYPLMVGRFASDPDPDLLFDTYGVVNYSFTEDANYPLAPAAYVPPVGIAAAAGLRPLFPWRPNWGTTPKSGGSEQDIDRQQIGQLRSMAAAYYSQIGRRKVSQDFTLSNADPLNLLAFFVAQQGEQNNFWLPAALSEASLTQNVLTTDAALHVDNVGAIGTNDFVLLDDLNNRVPLQVTGTAGSTWTLTGAVGTAFKQAATRIESLVLARFDVLKITLNFTDPTLATVTLKFKETPWETAAVAGETINVTQGALPVTAILFVFTLNVPGAAVASYFTNFERNLNDGVNTYVSAPIENEPITEAATLEKQTVKIKARNFAGNPLAQMIPFNLEWPLTLDIYEADVTVSAVPTIATLQAAGRCLFSGEVSGSDIDPPFINASCDSMKAIFDRQIPRRLYQRNCNWVLFESACGLLLANWQWNALVVSYNAATSTMVIGTITSTNGAALVAHFFSAGYCTITTAGVAQNRMVSDNTAPAAGQISLYLSSPLVTAPAVGDAVKLFPGCDGQKSTCLNKFNNYSAFGGFPFMPVGNPTVMKINQQAFGGGKK